MKVAISKYTSDGLEQSSEDNGFDKAKTQLVIGFGAKSVLENSNVLSTLKKEFPTANIVLSSTSGEIYDEQVDDDSLVISAIEFDNTPIKALSFNIKDFEDAEKMGEQIAKDLKKKDLKYVMIISDGGLINASLLLEGMQDIKDTLITGGLAGDGPHFQETWVGLNKKPKPGELVAIGFYGENIQASSGKEGGWEEFGLSRTITKSNYNELLEVDGKNILDLYKTYLGPYADELPASALLFPISLQFPDSEEKVVRTILSISEEDKSLTFAGDMPVGSRVRFMKSTSDSLIEAAENATKEAMEGMEDKNPKLAFLVSCVGRKLVLRSRVSEEVEEIKKVLPPNTKVFGYYSYGEISPNVKGTASKLHNQTLTITLLNEKSA